MNKLRHKILSFLMVPILLVSTTSFSMEKHICDDEIYSISFTGDAEDCGMEMSACDENTSENNNIFEDDCCENDLQIISGTTTNKNTNAQLSFNQTQFITYFVISNYYLFESTSNKPDSFEFYSPPTVLKNILSLFQIFII